MLTKRARRRARGLERVKKKVRSLPGAFVFKYTHMVIRKGYIQVFSLPLKRVLNLPIPGLHSL